MDPPHMPRQATTLRETLFTNTTWIRSFTGVTSHMDVEMLGQGEALFTFRAGVDLLARVTFHVIFQGTDEGETLLTHLT